MAGGRGQRSTHRHGAHDHAATGAPPHFAPQPPPPPITASAPLLDDLINEPVRIYPVERSSRGSTSPASSSSSPSAALLHALHGVPKHVVIVGVIATTVSSSMGIFSFMNRIIGRVAFMESNANDSALGNTTSPLLASIQLYYDESKSIAFLLGVSKSAQAFLASLSADPSNNNNNAERDVFADLEKFQNEKRKMELLMYTCSHILFNFQGRNQFTTNLLKDIRALTTEKLSLLAQLGAAAASGKTIKQRDKPTASQAVNVLSPGRCVPLVMFVVPAREELLTAPAKPPLPSSSSSSSSSTKSRSSAVAFCKAHETMLCGLFRSLRSNTVGIFRTRDAVSPANLSKERRLFHVDPTHCVAVISETAASEAGSVESRFGTVLDSFSLDFLANDSMDPQLDLDALLEPLEEDDIGYPQIMQHLARCIEQVQNVSSYPTPTTVPSGGGGGKDATAVVRVDLLSLAQWFKAFQSLTKALYRVEVKKKQDESEGSMRQQFEHMEVRS